MTTQITDPFSSDTSANYNGAGLTVSAGSANLDAAGITVHSTQLTGDDIWMRWTMAGDIGLQNEGPAISDGSGNGFIVIQTYGLNFELYYFTEYDTYTTYASNDDARSDNSGVAWGNNATFGASFDKVANVFNLWVSPSAAEPTDVSTWDSVSADISVGYGALGQTQDGDYLGWGSWGSTAANYASWTAGNFAAGGGPTGQFKFLPLLGVG